MSFDDGKQQLRSDQMLGYLSGKNRTRLIVDLDDFVVQRSFMNETIS